ncbi:hypothetical protein [Duganella sp. Leaf61]|uniref:hypothetical protein n=1 Tax=Duganella sp. Leaf61 TaxID=1736227 RepID=UPI000A723277|nr:hypothetical protein [Duganella sp. Leaf61]
MIKITKHLRSAGRANPDSYLKNQADLYWDALNPTKNGSYISTSLISAVQKYRDLADNLDEDYVCDYAGGDQFIALVQRDFFDEVLAGSADLLRKIIVSPPENLDLIKNDIKNRFPDEIFFTLNGAKKVQSGFGILLSETIFNYRKFRSSAFCLRYLQNLSFNEVYCPYCGDKSVELVGITSTRDEEHPEKALLDLDHFFSKSEFPYLSISLFNLIPCCHTCNSTYKLTKEFGLDTHIHPFAECFDEHFLFSIERTLHGRKVAISPSIPNAKDLSVSDFDLRTRYETKRKLLKIETDYKQRAKYRKPKDTKNFIDYMLKDVPLKQSEILSECHGKAKRDILRSIDVYNLLRPRIK